MQLNELELPSWMRRKKTPATPAQQEFSAAMKGAIQQDVQSKQQEREARKVDPRLPHFQSTNDRLAKIQAMRAKENTPVKQNIQKQLQSPPKQKATFGSNWSIVDSTGKYVPLAKAAGQQFSGQVKTAGSDKATPISGKIKSIQPGSETDKNVLMVSLEDGKSFLVSTNPKSIARPTDKFLSAQQQLAQQEKETTERQAAEAQQKANNAKREKLRQATKRAVKKAVKPDADFDRLAQLAQQGRTEALIQQFDNEILEEARKRKKKRKVKKFAKITKYPNSYPALRFYYGGLGHSQSDSGSDGGDGGGDGGGGGGE